MREDFERVDAAGKRRRVFLVLGNFGAATQSQAKGGGRSLEDLAAAAGRTRRRKDDNV